MGRATPKTFNFVDDTNVFERQLRWTKYNLTKDEVEKIVIGQDKATAGTVP